jgi:hypothetical protein
MPFCQFKNLNARLHFYKLIYFFFYGVNLISHVKKSVSDDYRRQPDNQPEHKISPDDKDAENQQYDPVAD